LTNRTADLHENTLPTNCFPGREVGLGIIGGGERGGGRAGGCARFLSFSLFLSPKGIFFLCYIEAVRLLELGAGSAQTAADLIYNENMLFGKV
jgi:hypothetical protein